MEENIRKSKKIYSLTKIVMFFLVLVLLVVMATKVVERKNSAQEYSDFMKLSNQIDVLFLGSSHVLDGVNPLQLFAEYGITSYNMGKHGGMLTESYWTLMNALDYCEPKCVVVDLWSLDRDYRYLDTKDGTSSVEDNRNSIAYLHNNLDFWPMSKTKIAAINDLIGEYEIRKEFYWDFITYHDRWSSLNSIDFEAVVGKDIADGNLGANPIYKVEPRMNISQEENTGELIPEDTISIQYLYKIIEECKERDIELIFTFLPMAYSFSQDWMAVDAAEKIANENNILFLNMLPHDSQRVVNHQTYLSYN